jgi:hypothetical protein
MSGANLDTWLINGKWICFMMIPDQARIAWQRPKEPKEESQENIFYRKTGISCLMNFLSNTEQALNLRTTGKLGAGKYIVHTNKQYWGLGAGLSLNNESFTNGTASRSSLKVTLVQNLIFLILEI